MNDFQKLVNWIDCGKLSVHEAQLVGGVAFKIAGASNSAAAKYATFTIVPENSIASREKPDFMQSVRDIFAMIPCRAWQGSSVSCQRYGEYAPEDGGAGVAGIS